MRSLTVNNYIAAISILLFTLWLSSCIKDDIYTGGDAEVSFSVDTLHFDTVFTQVGSATRSFKIYNRESSDIIISSAFMTERENSRFRINVDGLPGPVVNDIRIGANDSIYVFVEVTVDPDAPLSESPFVIEENFIIEVNGATGSILIDAWGQNANYIPNRFNRAQVYRLDCETEVWWDDPKPYVIYGLLVVDSCVLNIVAGTRVHVHGGIGRTQDNDGNVIFFNDGSIIIGPQGRLVTIGNADDPVIIEGDRLESEFNGTPGQWNGIRLLPGSKGNALSGTVIRNSVFGVYADSATTLRMSKTIIQNTSTAGLFCFHPDEVTVSNCLIAGNGANAATLSFGGKYNFEYTTMANFGNDREALFMTNHFCYDFPECTRWPVNDLEATFTNCIITGSNRDEVWLSALETASSDLLFDHCLIRVDELLDPDNVPNFLLDYTTSTINRRRTDSLFADVSSNDFALDTLSVAEQKGRPIPGVRSDLRNNQRDPVSPDLGAYEYQY
jgi:hypothetical protein